MKCQFQAHSDMINTLEMCERNERVLVISASSDCSVAMYDVLGNMIGIFGQVRLLLSHCHIVVVIICEMTNVNISIPIELKSLLPLDEMFLLICEKNSLTLQNIAVSILPSELNCNEIGIVNVNIDFIWNLSYVNQNGKNKSHKL